MSVRVGHSSQHHPKPLPTTYVGGRTFLNIGEFTKEIGKGAAVLGIGKQVAIALGKFPGGEPPKVTGLEKSSTFHTSNTDGVLTITADRHATVGSVAKVTLEVPSGLPGRVAKTPLTLEVGFTPEKK